MNGWLKWRLWLWLTAIIPTLLIIFLPGFSWLNLLALLWVALLGIVDVSIQRRLHKEQLANTISSTHKQWITIMNHHRHDWMNDLQVLFGYIRLGKQEQVIEYVERIKGKMLAESSLSKLNEPHLVSYLYGFRCNNSSLQLDISFQSDDQQSIIQINDELSAALIIEILSAYRLYINKESFEEQLLQLIFHQQQDGLHITFKYDGSMGNETVWRQKIEQLVNSHSDACINGPINAQFLKIQLTTT